MSDWLHNAYLQAGLWLVWLWRQPYGQQIEIAGAIILVIVMLWLISITERHDRERMYGRGQQTSRPSKYSDWPR